MIKSLILWTLLIVPNVFAESQNAQIQSTEKIQSEPLHPLLTIPVAPLAILAPGTAHYLRGDETTSDDLYELGGNSFLVFLSSALVLGASGAADQTTFPFISLAMGGAAGWLAFSSIDLVGSALDKTINPDYPSFNTFSNRVGIEYTKVPSPIFLNTAYTGITFTHQRSEGTLDFRYIASDEGGIKVYSLDYGKNIVQRDKANQGFYLHFKVKHEENPLGFYNMTTLEPTFRLITDGTMFSTGLDRIFLKAKFGLQQHLIQYEENAGGSHETDSSMVGDFETSWIAYSWLKPLLGYRHERESLVASQNTGFTGVFFGGSEFHLGGNYFLKLRNYLGGETSWDLNLYTTF